MRNTENVYWSTSLPRDHQALQTLDAYCQEWGGLSRAEATRRLLIEWDKLRRGESPATWISQQPSSQQSMAGSHQLIQQASGATNKPMRLNPTAKAASQSLDD